MKKWKPWWILASWNFEKFRSHSWNLCRNILCVIPFGYSLCVIKCFQFFRLLIWKPFVYQELCWTLGIQIWDIILALKRFKSYHKDSTSWEPILSSFLFPWHLEYLLTQINLLKLTMLTPPANILPNGEGLKALPLKLRTKLPVFQLPWKLRW